MQFNNNNSYSIKHKIINNSNLNPNENLNHTNTNEKNTSKSRSCSTTNLTTNVKFFIIKNFFLILKKIKFIQTYLNSQTNNYNNLNNIILNTTANINNKNNIIYSHKISPVRPNYQTLELTKYNSSGIDGKKNENNNFCVVTTENKNINSNNFNKKPNEGILTHKLNHSSNSQYAEKKFNNKNNSSNYFKKIDTSSIVKDLLFQKLEKKNENSENKNNNVKIFLPNVDLIIKSLKYIRFPKNYIDCYKVCMDKLQHSKSNKFLICVFEDKKIYVKFFLFYFS